MPACAEAHALVVTRRGWTEGVEGLEVAGGDDESKEGVASVPSEVASGRVTVASDPNDEGAEDDDNDAADGLENDVENELGSASMAAAAAASSGDAEASGTADERTPGADDAKDGEESKKFPATRLGPGNVRPMTTMAATVSATGR